ncbi:hypothetical protein EDD68_103185 [Melghiribacillus thermohalophilus]|uniref:DUF309 domain-containing protein n=1 Tax=Melghiribacillus thermohalophilus TaxID=1324956 RepID=A0A4R3NAE7_9BACI|nr:DUF309 domain-containing protein [Melghiribacillus thermohalophilus]TCT25630.1 hypothetical protein EDD68_103185 [Melghiribacillus thermohalophilus]
MFDQAFIEYLAHFHCTRDYFECHEILEERWKQEYPLDRDSIWVAFIQLSVSLYHYRRGNTPGAKRLIQKSIQKFQKHQDMLSSFGLDRREFFIMLTQIESRILEDKPYVDVCIPITHNELKKAIKKRCSEWNHPFPSKSDLSNYQLVDRHKNRQ